MPRARTSAFWVNQIRSIVEADERTTLAEITRKLEAQARELGKQNEVPSESTIKRERKNYLSLPDEVRRGYRFVYWPESFETGELPWEAASAVAELMRATLPVAVRVPVPYASQFWRVSAAGPSLPFELRRQLALLLRISDIAPVLSANAIHRDVERVVFGGTPVTTAIDLNLPTEALPLMLETFEAAGATLNKADIEEWIKKNLEGSFRVVLEEVSDAQG